MVKRNKLLVPALAATLVAAATMSSPASAAERNRFDDSRPGGLSMMADALLARPVLIGATAIGAGMFVVSMPFALIGGTTGDTWGTLVVTPAEAAFVRCLGCTPVQDERIRTERRTARQQAEAAAAAANSSEEEAAN